MAEVVDAVVRPATRQPAEGLKYFDRLLSLTVRHGFYASGSSEFGQCPDFVITPTRETETLLRNLRLLLRPRAAGIDVLYNTGDATAIVRRLWTHRDRRRSNPVSSLDNQRVRDGSWSRLTFIFNVKNPFFTNFTDMPFAVRPSSECLYLSNREVGDDGVALDLQWARAISLQEQTFSPAHLRIQTDKHTDATQVVLLDPSGRCILSAEKDYEPPATDSGLRPGSSRFGLRRLGFRPGHDIHVDMSAESPGLYSYVIKPAPDIEMPLIYAATSQAPFLLVDLFLANPEPGSGSPGVYPIILPNDEPPADSGTADHSWASKCIAPRDNEIRFAARKTLWTYYVVFPAGAGAASDVAIEPQSTEGPVFSRPEIVTLPTGRAAHQFTAQTACPLRAQPAGALQLRGALGGGPSRILLGSLPLPSAESIRASPDPKQPAASDVFVYL